MNSTSCFLIMAGGTGGHVFPALAVAKELLQRNQDVCWLGTEVGMESHLVPANNIKFETIAIKGFRGKGLLSKLAVPFLLVRAVVQAAKVIRKVNPCVVIGFGGFVSAPGGIAARLLGKQLIIHEQNSVAGTSNRLLNTLSNKTLTAYPNNLKGAALVGNPIRTGLSSIENDSVENDNTDADQKLNLLIMGGSLGAKAINEIVPAALSLIDDSIRPNVWHQTGRSKKEPVVNDYKDLSVSARTEEFIDSVDEAYSWADVLICRAGALTVSEVAAVGMPAIFIPLPSAIDNHQYHNARWLSEQDAAVLIEQKTLTKELLSETLTNFISQKEILKTMGKKAKALAMPNATNDVANICEELCHVS